MASWHNKIEKLVFVQSGVMVRYLHLALEEKGLALMTTGDSDGQRLVGGSATGTHGSANQVGSIHDSIRGIHLVLQMQ